MPADRPERTRPFRASTCRQGSKHSADAAVLGDAEIVLFVMPSQAHREAARQYGPSINAAATIVTCAKGMEQATGRLLTDVLAEELPGHGIGVLSGPGFAADIAKGPADGDGGRCRRQRHGDATCGGCCQAPTVPSLPFRGSHRRAAWRRAEERAGHRLRHRRRRRFGRQRPGGADLPRPCGDVPLRRRRRRGCRYAFAASRGSATSC